MLDKEGLYNVRNAITNSPGEFAKLLEQEDFKRKWGTIQGEKNKIIPKEFQEAFSKQPLIANKQFYYWAEVDARSILKANLPDFMMDYYHAGKAMNKFLKKALTGN